MKSFNGFYFQINVKMSNNFDKIEFILIINFRFGVNNLRIECNEDITRDSLRG